jgi:hypothetical protein
MPPKIPPRQPIGETFNGVVLRYADRQALALTAQAGTETLASGQFVVRYGVRYLGTSFLSIVPGLLVLDYGDMLTGEDAWSFLTKKSNLHPRADVVGYRNDGQDDMVMVRTLDMGQPVEVLVYADEQATKPVYFPTALIVPSAEGLPPYLTEYLPCYDSLDAWNTNV